MTFEQLVAEWHDRVGPAIANVARPAAFALTTGQLYILVVSGAWMAEMENLARELRATALPETIDGVRISAVRFVGPRASRHPPRRAS